MDWFNGNSDAQDLYEKLVFVAHLWDDLVDGESRSEDDINNAFMFCLVHIPANKLYRTYQVQLAPLIHTAVVGYMTATKMEKSGDMHQVEIAHGLRYAVAQVAVFMVVLTNTHERALEILPELWKQMMPERWEEYSKEHKDAA